MGRWECVSDHLPGIVACVKEDFINHNFVFSPKKIIFCHKTILLLTNGMAKIVNLKSKSAQGV